MSTKRDDIFGCIDWEILPAFIAHGVPQKTEDERKQILNSYKEQLVKSVIADSHVSSNA